MRYADLRPDQLAAKFASRPIVIWPLGALEWHGPHLPLGLDGLVAEAFAEKLAQRSGGVLLPTTWHPITTLPHPMSLDIPAEAFRTLLDSTVSGLGRAGAKVVCLVTGHYAQGHSVELFRFAASRQEGPTVIAASPLEPLEDDSLLDHAARWETAQLLAIRPDLVDLEILPEAVRGATHATLGEDPRLGSPDAAERLWETSIERWIQWIDAALSGDRSELIRFYIRREAVYKPYIERFFRESWEQAIQDWWSERLNSEK